MSFVRLSLKHVAAHIRIAAPQRSVASHLAGRHQASTASWQLQLLQPAPVTSRCVRAFSYKRENPDAPRVGVGITILRSTAAGTEVLLVLRAKAPNKGEWCIPGGGLELGETLAQCAVRETKEETGIDLRQSETHYSQVKPSRQLLSPTPFSAVDVITREDNNEIGFHYAIIEMAATPKDPDQTVTPGDDVSAAKWVACSELNSVENITPDVPRVIGIAMSQFDLD